MYLRENMYINGNSIVLKDRSEGKCKVREKEKSTQKTGGLVFFPLSFYRFCTGGGLVSGNTEGKRLGNWPSEVSHRLLSGGESIYSLGHH